MAGVEKPVKQWAAGIGSGLLNWAQGLADMIGAGPLVAEFTNRTAGDAAGTGYISDADFQALLSRLIAKAQKTVGLDYDKFTSQLAGMPASSPAIKSAVSEAAARLARSAQKAHLEDNATSARLGRAQQLAAEASAKSQQAGAAVTNEVGRLQQSAIDLAKGIETPVKKGDWVNG